MYTMPIETTRSKKIKKISNNLFISITR